MTFGLRPSKINIELGIHQFLDSLTVPLTCPAGCAHLSMSDRVARLAALRRQRDSSLNGAKTEELARDEEVGPSKPIAAESESLDAVPIEAVPEEPVLALLSEPVLTEPILAEKAEHSDLGRNGNSGGELKVGKLAKTPITSLTEAHTSAQGKGTYNSDLKADMDGLLTRAKRDTDRAIARYLQKQYQESLQAGVEE